MYRYIYIYTVLAVCIHIFRKRFKANVSKTPASNKSEKMYPRNRNGKSEKIEEQIAEKTNKKIETKKRKVKQNT